MSAKALILWGLVISGISALLFVCFVILSALTLGKFREVANMFGVLAMGALPTGILCALVRRFLFRESIILVVPDVWYEASVREAVTEFEKEMGKRNIADRFVTRVKESGSFEEYVRVLNGQAEGKFLKEGFVPNTTYWLVRDGRFLGHVNIRHELTEHLREAGGHIGYAIRPSERKKGYGHIILRLALPKCTELGITRVRVTCAEDNRASAKIIEKNGGVFDGTVESEGETIRRYWIPND